MRSNWNIEIEKPRYAAKRLASLQVESPANSQTSEEIGILLSLWCGRETIHVEIDDATSRFSVGFTVGEIEVSVKNGRISSQNRYQQEFFREKVDQNTKDTSSKNRSVGAFLGLDLAKWLPGTKVSAEGGAKISKDSVALESKEGNYYRVYWRVADAGHNTWRCFGLGLNEDGVLENKILGDEILCFIVPDCDERDIEIVVRYHCDVQDLWFQLNGSHSASLLEQEKKEHRNREAVSSAVLAKALNRSSRQIEGAASRRRVVLCQQRLFAKRCEEVDDA